MHIPLYSTLIRLALRAYFIVTLFFIALVGDAVCRSRNKLRLLRGHHVTLVGMTGWVNGISSFDTAARLRRLPGGWLGALMLLATILSVVCDLGVSVFVTQLDHSSRCRFEMGMVMNSNASWVPSVNGQAYLQASNAQLYSMTNWNGHTYGLPGIYRTVPNDTNFFPWSKDILGGWECAKVSLPLGYTGSSDEQIVSSLVSQGLLHPHNCTTSLANRDTDGKPLTNTTQLVSFSVPSIIQGENWDNVVKIALDIDDGESGYKKTMQAYQCLLQTNEEDPDYSNNNQQLLRGIVGHIQISKTLPRWIDHIQGALYLDYYQTTVVPYPKDTIEWLLNSMIMVAGGSNRVTTTSDSSHDHFGCLVPGTRVPTQIEVLVLVVGFLAVALVVYYCYLSICIFRARRRYDAENNGSKVSSKELCNNVPNGLLDWMSHAAHESNNVASKPRHHHLNGWLLSTRHHGGRRMGVVPRDQANAALLSPGLSDASTPTVVQSPRGFFNQKTGYAAVETVDIRN